MKAAGSLSGKLEYPESLRPWPPSVMTRHNPMGPSWLMTRLPCKISRIALGELPRVKTFWSVWVVRMAYCRREGRISGTASYAERVGF